MAKRARRADDAAQAGEGATAVQRVLEEYLTELNQIRATGAAVEETSYYPALANLFNAVGRTLKPKVRCNLHPRNQGAGMPDGGLWRPTSRSFGGRRQRRKRSRRVEVNCEES